MLSIIISSYQPEYFSAVEKNIASTVGIPHEIIKIENPGKMGLCKAYNIGTSKAKYDYFLFLHEDVSFESQDWGVELLKILNLKNCGVVGLAGSNYYGYVPSSWWNEGYKKIHIIQAESSSENKTYNIRANFSENISLEKVKALDGVFLACKKSVYSEFPFDEVLTGYHGYDILFSLKIAKHYQNYVTDKILLTHFSKGTLNGQWLEAILKVKELIGKSFEKVYDRNLELKNFYKLLNHFKKYNTPKRKAFKIILKYLNPKILGLKNCIKIINKTKYLFC